MRAPLVIGFAGSLALALGAAATGFSFHPGGWPWPPMAMLGSVIARRPDAVFLSLFGAVAMSIAWWLARDASRLGRYAIWWALPMLLLPPVMTSDTFAYADAAWVVSLGADPYTTPVASLGGPYAESVDTMWRGTSVPYPPIGVVAAYLAAAGTGFHPYFGVIAQRFLVLGALALVWWLMPRLVPASRVAAARWLAILNPITMIQGVGGAHNDFVMAGLAFSAVAVAAGGHWLGGVAKSRPHLRFVLGSALAGLAMGVKPQAGLVVLAVAVCSDPDPVAGGWPARWRLIWRTSLSTVICLAVFGLASVGWGFGWTKALSQSSMARTPTLFFLGRDTINAFTRVFGLGSDRPLNTWGLVLIAAALVLLAGIIWRYYAQPLVMVTVGSFLVVAANRSFLSWYLALPLVLLGAMGLSRKAWPSIGAALSATSFSVMCHHHLGVGIWPRVGFWLGSGLLFYLFFRRDGDDPASASRPTQPATSADGVSCPGHG